ncbi:ABC transporter permease [Deinococcus pimensis]|uniref:ABC transporter permease n=1 Tax=Deinococcus pimensis TaxID=309888 RepID=UPI0004810B60|nr:ABC transporter permease [Deinococcus pimensis]
MTTQVTESSPARRANLLERLFRAREASLVLILLALVAATSAVNPRFVAPQSLRDLLLNVSIIALVVVGQTLVLLMKHVDLSVSSVVGLTAFLSGSLFVANPGLPVPVVLLAGVVMGALLGAVNGLLVAYGRVPALVATLGTLYVFRGVDYAVVQGGQINASNLPAAFSHLATGSVLGVPTLALLVLAVMVVFAVYLRSYRGGREYYAVGSNVDAAVLAGIDVTRRVMTGFVLSGAIAGLAGVLYLARYGTVDAAAGTGLELQVIAAAVVGGVSIGGGVGTLLGAGTGALLLGAIASALVTLRAPAFWQQAIQGALLLLAISVDIVLARRAARALQERSQR